MKRTRGFTGASPRLARKHIATAVSYTKAAIALGKALRLSRADFPLHV